MMPSSRRSRRAPQRRSMLSGRSVGWAMAPTQKHETVPGASSRSPRLEGALLAGFAGLTLGFLAAFVRGWDFVMTPAVCGGAGGVLGALFGPRVWPLLQWF